MPHLDHKPRLRNGLRKDLLVGALVGGSMLIITGIYAALFRYEDIFPNRPADYSRWSALAEGVIIRAKPLQVTILDVKDKITAITKAGFEQRAAVAAMKAKIEAGTVTSATPTPETR